MTEDSLLPKAVDYFRKHGDREKVMKGYILKANYLKWIDRLDDAIAELDSGVAQAKQANDSVNVRDLLYYKANIVYDSTKFVSSSISEVEQSLIEAVLIVALVVLSFRA